MTLLQPLRRLIAPVGRWPRLVVLAACLAIVGMYCTNQDMAGQPDAPRGDGVYRPVLARGDGHMQYLVARSTALDLDWRFDNDLARFGDPWREPVTKTGRKAIVQPLGPALVWTPLIWIAEAGAAIADALGADIPLHGYTLWHQRFVFLSSALLGCAAVVLGWLLARRLGLGAWRSTYAAVAILLGTSLAYYATYMPSYAHAMDAGVCAMFLAYWADTLGRNDVWRWLVLGALLGLAMLIRVQELALGVVVAVEIVAAIVGDLRRHDLEWRVRALLWIGGGALALVTALVVFVPQLVEWHVVFGNALALPQGARYTRPGSPMVLELLFAPRNGWLSTTPLAYAGLLGLALLPKRHRTLQLGLVAAVIVQIYLASTIADWWGGASFGQRRLCDVTLPLVVGLAALLWRCGLVVARWPRVPRIVWHAIAATVLGVFVAWNLERVGELRGGKPAESEIVATCCDHVPDALRGPARWIYDRIGNPFELPASAWFAIRHGVELTRWDRLVGAYPLQPAFGAFRDDKLVHQRGTLTIGGPGAANFLLDGWSPSEKQDRPQRWTLAPRAAVLVPNLMPEDQKLTLWVRAGTAHAIAIEWDGTQVATATLGEGWQAVTFTVRAMPVGIHELAITSGATERGVAVNQLELEIIPPLP